jgi:hypothetical protein
MDAEIRNEVGVRSGDQFSPFSARLQELYPLYDRLADVPIAYDRNHIDYSFFKKEHLKLICKRRNLPYNKTKDELIEDLRNYDRREGVLSLQPFQIYLLECMQNRTEEDNNRVVQLRLKNYEIRFITVMSNLPL